MSEMKDALEAARRVAVLECIDTLHRASVGAGADRATVIEECIEELRALKPLATSTDKAVGELLDKVDTIIAEEAERLSDCTVFFAAEIMRERIAALTASRASSSGEG